jgi:YEATS domain-containing protein 4
VRPVPGGPDISVWLKKVVFVLHDTFPNPVRTVDNAPFELEETGYGGFFIAVKLYFQPIAAEKQQQRQHFLQLEGYGDDALRATQERTGIVRSEIVEYIEFNEPTEALYDALTSENQWDYIGRGRAKGKSAGRNSIPTSLPTPSLSQRTVELPDNAPSGSVFSKDTEDALIKTLEEASKKVEVEMAEVLKQMKNVNEKTLEIKKSTDTDAKLLGLHDKLPAAPPKKK